MNLHRCTDAVQARQADAAALAEALTDARRLTLNTFAVYEQALAAQALAVPYSPQLNPPLWELGHVDWFQQWWLGRNPQRHRGAAADPDVARTAARRTNADALYDSSRVPHRTRWGLPLPSVEQTRNDLAQGLEESLSLLRTAPGDDDGLYFFRLCLLHEDMHQEAAVYMAQHLGIELQGWQPRAHAPPHEIAVDSTRHSTGAPMAGFMFDNELGPHSVELQPYAIDSSPVTWGRYLQFVESGGYQQQAFWGDDGWRWLQQQGLSLPRYLRASGSQWQQHSFGRWIDVDAALPAMHLSAFEAQAYCAWAGRRLPTEAEWECAAQTTAGFEWGQVWEWTSSPFAPYPGFTPHPYRDYSAPWFHACRALRGSSFATQPRMRHTRYRNFFSPDRNDIHAGFRTCATAR